LKGDPRRAVDPSAVAERLAADTGREIKAILVVQIDTHQVWSTISPPSDRRSTESDTRAPDGGLRGLAGMHAVRDGRLGDRRGHVGLAEGPDDAARPGLRRRQ
jgi:hypothetical protein